MLQVHFWRKRGLCEFLSQLSPLVMSDNYQYVDAYYKSIAAVMAKV